MAVFFSGKPAAFGSQFCFFSLLHLCHNISIADPLLRLQHVPILSCNRDMLLKI